MERLHRRGLRRAAACLRRSTQPRNPTWPRSSLTCNRGSQTSSESVRPEASSPSRPRSAADESDEDDNGPLRALGGAPVVEVR